MSGDVVDQIFIRAKQWLLSWLAGAPDWIIQITSSLLNIFALLGVFLTLFALISVLERKILGRMQNRYGPNRVGPFGLFQPIADGIKMLIKEDIVPARADKIVHFLAPILIAATAILRRHSLTLGDIGLWELNEAFAAQVLACLAAWEDDTFCREVLGLPAAAGRIDRDKLNVDGGAIGLGHPVGASGNRIVLHLVNAMKRLGVRQGIATECIGGGQGGAMLIEAV